MGYRHVATASPTLDTNAYADGDHMGTVMTISGAAEDLKGPCHLRNVVVVDGAKQSGAMTLLFFSESPTVASSDNAALDITDAEMAAKFIGSVSIAAADHITINASSFAVNTVDLLLKSEDTSQIFAILRADGAQTYTASSLTFRFGFD